MRCLSGPTPDAEGWQERAAFLRNQTVLTPRQAEIQALVEAGLSRQDLADALDISPSTVGSHRQAIRERVRRAATTVDEVEIE